MGPPEKDRELAPCGVIEGELGSFLHSRREAVTLAEVGLPEGPRRRTPGPRRAELATWAGVSVDYLPDPDRQRLVVCLPADAASSAALDRLVGRQPSGLRSVSAG